MNLLRRSRGRSGGNQADSTFPGMSMLAKLSLSTKLILLVAVPMRLTLAVTLPITVTGLNRLAGVIALERLGEEVRIIDQQFENFASELDDVADDVASDAGLLRSVRENNKSAITSSLLATRIRMRLHHLEVVDYQGVVVGLEQQ